MPPLSVHHQAHFLRWTFVASTANHEAACHLCTSQRSVCGHLSKKKQKKANVISYGYKIMSCFGCDAKVVGSNLNFHILHGKV